MEPLNCQIWASQMSSIKVNTWCIQSRFSVSSVFGVATWRPPAEFLPPKRGSKMRFRSY